MLLLPLLIASTALLPKAGLWEFQSGLAGMGGKDERRCLSQEEVEHFLNNPSNRHYDCSYPTHQVGAGKVRLKGVCTSRKHPDQKIGVSVAGTYTPETIDLKGRGTARVIGALELPLDVAFSARRVGSDCGGAVPAASPSPMTDGPSTQPAPPPSGR